MVNVDPLSREALAGLPIDFMAGVEAKRSR
jgi:hypothetical protein